MEDKEKKGEKKKRKPNRRQITYPLSTRVVPKESGPSSASNDVT
jgi:hypothetical protein